MTRVNISWALALLLLSLNLQAHSLRLFASLQGNEVNGEAYFAGAGPAANADIYLEQQGKRLISISSDAEGLFTLTLPRPGDYLLIADAGQGHQASWPLKASSALAATAHNTPVSNSSAEPIELSNQLRALQRDIEQLRSERRLQDVIGGLGYILGLAGLAAWILARRRRVADGL